MKSSLSSLSIIIDNHDHYILLSTATPTAAHCVQHIMSPTRLVDWRPNWGWAISQEKWLLMGWEISWVDCIAPTKGRAITWDDCQCHQLFSNLAKIETLLKYDWNMMITVHGLLTGEPVVAFWARDCKPFHHTQEQPHLLAGGIWWWLRWGWWWWGWWMMMIIIAVNDWGRVGKRDGRAKENHESVCQCACLWYLRWLSLLAPTGALIVMKC